MTGEKFLENLAKVLGFEQVTISINSGIRVGHHGNSLEFCKEDRKWTLGFVNLPTNEPFPLHVFSIVSSYSVLADLFVKEMLMYSHLVLIGNPRIDICHGARSLEEILIQAELNASAKI